MAAKSTFSIFDPSRLLPTPPQGARWSRRTPEHAALPHNTPSGDRSGGLNPTLLALERTLGSAVVSQEQVLAPLGYFEIPHKGTLRRKSGWRGISWRHKMRVAGQKSVFWTQWRLFGVRWASLAAHDRNQNFRVSGRTLGSLFGPQEPFWAPVGAVDNPPKGILRRESDWRGVHRRQKMRFASQKSVFRTQWRIFGVCWATLVTHGESRDFRDF